ncbi:lactonase family protein [Stieleria varia]|nr:lactonase family protein [Stieleria varia]
MFQLADAHAETVDVWFGTSTPRNGLSKGIYHAKFDTEKGELSQATLAAEADGPGFLALHPNGNVLYSVGNHEGKPSVSAYTIHRDGAQTSLTWHSSAEIGDGGAAHVSVDRTGKVLFTAQYGGGSTAAFRLDDDGGIVERTGLYKHVGGSDVVPNRQTSPHAHWTGTSPDNRFLFVPDLGMDQVVIWKVDTETATLTPHGFGQSVPGGGPRHMKFHPNGKIVYLLNELSLSVTVFDYDAKAGTMSPKQTIETLSEAVKAGERFNSSSEIRVHPNGKFVYAANRGNDSITAYRVKEADGTLELIEVEPIRGAWPRNFALDPTGKWLLAAGQNTNSVTIFEIDQQSGQLQFTMKAAMVPTPICVLFAE